MDAPWRAPAGKARAVLTISLVLLGAVLIALTLADRAVRRLPLTPAVIYLVVGYAGGALLGSTGPDADSIEAHAPALVVGTELAVLVSLFGVGLRLRIPPTLRAWRVALLMAGPGMVVAIVLGAVAAALLLDLPWAPALLLGAIMAPTDPVLASEVQIRADGDRDAVRLSITAEGGLNDGTSLPAVMLALGLMGLHPLGAHGASWWWHDLLLPIGGGAVLGVGMGLLLGRALKRRVHRDDKVARDELLYIGVVTLAYGLARATGTSSFVVVFALGTMLMSPLRGGAAAGGQAIAERLRAFGARGERLVEAMTVLAVGAALHGIDISWQALVFGLVLVGVVRPLAVIAVVRGGVMSASQRRLVAWFGIRGVGSLFYLALALEHGVAGGLARELMGAVLAGIALSIVLHGVSATPLMTKYQQRRGGKTAVDAPPAAGNPGNGS